MGHGVVPSAPLQYLSLVVMVVVVLFQHGLAHIVDDWSETLPYEKMGAKDQMKVTRLHFYSHYILTGDDPTAVLVAQPLQIHPWPTNFGSLYMADNPLTLGPELTSKLVGRYQGLLGYTGQEERVLIMAVSFVFTDEKFNGSTLSILTRNPTMDPVREYAIVGGTGFFRFAHGYAITRRVDMSDETTPERTIEYDATVYHY